MNNVCNVKISMRCGELNFHALVCAKMHLVIKPIVLWSYQSSWILQNSMPMTLDKLCKLELKLVNSTNWEETCVQIYNAAKETLGLVLIKSCD